MKFTYDSHLNNLALQLVYSSLFQYFFVDFNPLTIIILAIVATVTVVGISKGLKHGVFPLIERR